MTSEFDTIVLRRDRLHDDHAGRGGEPADEDQQRQRLLALGHRQRQNVRVGVDLPVAEPEQPADRDRQHEDVDDQQVEREQPACAQEVPLVDVLHNRDLPLPRQQHDREHRQHREPHPVAVVLGRRA